MNSFAVCEGASRLCIAQLNKLVKNINWLSRSRSFTLCFLSVPLYCALVHSFIRTLFYSLSYITINFTYWSKFIFQDKLTSYFNVSLGSFLEVKRTLTISDIISYNFIILIIHEIKIWNSYWFKLTLLLYELSKIILYL